MLFEYIQRNPDICSNCFRRIRETYERNYAVGIAGRELYAKKLPRDTPDLKITLDDKTDYVAKDPASVGTRTVCECGVPPGATVRPLSKERFMDHGQRLADRINELRVSGNKVDEATFFTELEHLKSQPDNQFDEDAMYASAVDRAKTSAVKPTI